MQSVYVRYANGKAKTIGSSHERMIFYADKTRQKAAVGTQGSPCFSIILTANTLQMNARTVLFIKTTGSSLIQIYSSGQFDSLT